VAKSAGYSGTPLVKKLGLKPEHRAVVIRPPADYRALIDNAEILESTLDGLSGEYDFIHVFNPVTAALEEAMPICEKHLVQKGGMIWASWPKKSSKLWVDLTEGGIRTEAFKLNLVDVKVCAVDKDWSGLKLMRRKKK